MVNWDPVLQTALSDDEVEAIDKDGFMFPMAYPLSDGSGESSLKPRVLRPSLDTAVAVNAEDERYKDMIGKFMLLIVNRAIPIIADNTPTRPKGSGAVNTPSMTQSRSGPTP